MALDLKYLAQQLQKRWGFDYRWGQKQNDLWDGYTNFIYKTAYWPDLLKLVDLTAEAYELDKNQVFQYAANRWYNYWSARAIEQIFCNLENVVPALNPKDRLIDFSIQGIDFDHKTSVFPRGFNQTLYYAQHHKKELIEWLYKNQSQQQRKHLKNRLFVLVFSENGEHWKIKGNLPLIQNQIEHYMGSFHRENLIKLEWPNEQASLSDIIWVVQ